MRPFKVRKAIDSAPIRQDTEVRSMDLDGDTLMILHPVKFNRTADSGLRLPAGNGLGLDPPWKSASQVSKGTRNLRLVLGPGQDWTGFNKPCQEAGCPGGREAMQPVHGTPITARAHLGNLEQLAPYRLEHARRQFSQRLQILHANARSIASGTWGRIVEGRRRDSYRDFRRASLFIFRGQDDDMA